MQRPEVDLLISLNEDFDKFNTPSNTEDICGWDNLLNRFPIKKPKPINIKSLIQTPRISKPKERNKRNISLAMSVKKEPVHLNLSPLNITAINLNKKSKKKPKETLFPVIRSSLYNYANEKSSKWNNFEISFERGKDIFQDKAIRLTSATPVALVRRKNLYY